MATPRSEAYLKSRDSEDTIRDPAAESVAGNKIDHYGVLSPIVNSGIEFYLSTPWRYEELESTDSFASLEATLADGITQSINAYVSSKDLEERIQKLDASQFSRYVLRLTTFEDTQRSIAAGNKTFISIFSKMFHILKRISTETASDPNNWKIVYKLSMLNLDHLRPYFSTYLAESQNWSGIFDHLEVSESGGVAFKPGFPGLAKIPVNKHKNSPVELAEDESILLRDIEISSPTIGCPISFKPANVQALWTLYAHNAKRLSLPPLNSDDTEASLS